jgi:hypothetical protein
MAGLMSRVQSAEFAAMLTGDAAIRRVAIHG